MINKIKKILNFDDSNAKFAQGGLFFNKVGRKFSEK